MRRKLLAHDAKMQLEHHQLVAAQRLHDFNQLQREWVVKQNEQFLLILQAARPTCYVHVLVQLPLIVHTAMVHPSEN